MSPASKYWRLFLVGLFAVCLLTWGTAGAVAAGGLAPATSSGPSEAAPAPVDAQLADVTGEQEVLVHFESADSITGPNAVEQLQADADRAQAPFIEFAAETPDVTVERTFWITNAATVRVDTDEVDLSTIAAVKGVESVGPNPTVSGEMASLETIPGDDLAADSAVGATAADGSTVGAATADDPSYGWGLRAINVPEVWDEHDTRGEGITVAVLDSGIDTDHPELEIEGWGDWDTDGTPRNTEPTDYDVEREPSGHGTHVAGIVAAEDGSNLYLGVSPDVDLLAGAALTDCDASGCDAQAAQIIAGIEWAVENDADVLTISIGLDVKDPAFIEPIRNAQNAGTFVVASAGNDGLGTSTSPGNDYDSVSVGASDTEAGILDMSGGEVIFTDLEWEDPPDDWPEVYVHPTVSAPGEIIASTVVGGQYARGSGTSQAAPHVAGTAALIQSATDEQLTPEEIELVLVETAFKPDEYDEEPDVRYGHGIIDAAAAVDLAVEGDFDDLERSSPGIEETPSPEDTPTPTPDDTATSTPDDTATSTPEDAATSTPEDTSTEDDDGTLPGSDDADDSMVEVPGFGVGIALIALLVSALQLVRRGRD